MDHNSRLQTVTVIIPTYNRAGMLAKVLPSYLQFPLMQEVLVIDDGSTDDTSEIVREFASSDSRIRLIQQPRNLGRILARNTGIEQATGELLLMSEDDLALAPGSLDVLLAHMRASNADIIAGRRIWMRIGETEEAALARANGRRWSVVNRRLLEHHSHAIVETDVPAPLVDATMLVRREVLEKVRYADCYPGNAWREESDFQLTALENGYKIVFCPHTLFFHYDRSMAGRGRNRFKADLVYLYWMYRNNLTFLRRHQGYLSQHIPESLILNNPHITNLIYIVYRAALLAQTEIRRAWLTHKHRDPSS
ncbi:MAG: GalNAc(5)-diNAcBac-PP-undecaprenol beta-1,3-glucosyltransferase [Chloroflexi bacterium ADurb.Bin360]|nr:MAG: GalNAc(5)-diNAcBac-PP-undecaprenol beta-1,3-glucosyltransferase [Chloroflexi bacterium ADurb.Bin360]